MAAPKTTTRTRITHILFAITIVMAYLLFVSLARWQIVRAAALKEEALDQWTRKRIVEPLRGEIQDRNGTTLALSASCDMVLVRPGELAQADKKADGTLESVAALISQELELDYDAVLTKASNTSKSEVLLKRQVDNQIGDRIRAMKTEGKLPGIYLSEDKMRYYPMRNFLSQVLGFTSVDSDGLEGIEARFDKYLKGTEGQIVNEADLYGGKLADSAEQYIAPIDGSNVQLTIDAGIQSFAEKAMDLAMAEQKAKSAVCIVMDPNTFEILAIVNKPDYDNNSPPRQDAALLSALTRNTAISDSYEPGSTFKIITLAAGLDSGVITTGSTFNCPGYRIIDGQRIRCWSDRPHGHQTLAKGVQQSCNPVFMDISQRMGNNTFYEYIYSFGFGKTSGVQLYGEAAGIVTAPKFVKSFDLARIGFGQSIAMTPLQLISAVSAAINGGTLYTPTIVKQIVDPTGAVVQAYEPAQVAQVIRPETSTVVRELLQGVVDSGSGRNAAIEGYSVGGKTGTAQKYGPTGAVLHDKHISSFIGFAPANNPRFIVLVAVDEPGSGVSYGSIVAAPYVKMILEDSLKLYSVMPDREIENGTPQATVPDLIGKDAEQAQKALSDAGLTAVVEGQSGHVIAQFPEAQAQVNAQSAVVVCLENEEAPDAQQPIQTPDVLGKTAIEANAEITSKGLIMKFKGTGGVAVSQTPQGGEDIYPGQSVEVEFATPESQNEP